MKESSILFDILLQTIKVSMYQHPKHKYEKKLRTSTPKHKSHPYFHSVAFCLWNSIRQEVNDCHETSIEQTGNDN